MTEKFKIEKNIPIPTTGKYPLSEMEIGDSFLVPEDQKPEIARATVSAYQRRFEGIRFATRTVEGGVRVWRIA